MMGLDLTEDDIAALEARTEGWIAGLQLAALSMHGHDDVPGFISSFTGSHRFVLDFLVEEVLQRQPVQIRDFLLQTSVLDRLSGPLCNAVTGQDQASVMLEALERANLFVIPLDDQRTWFRYHHLFAEVLQMRAAVEQPEKVAVWHQRSSQWFAENEMPSEAIRHAFAAGDFERAANLAERMAHDMLMGRQEEKFIEWVRQLPEEKVRKRPVLSAYYALALTSFDLVASEAPLRDAERFLALSPDEPEHLQTGSHEFEIADDNALRSLRGMTCITRAYKAGAMGNVSGIVDYAQQALEHLPEDQFLWRGAVASLLGLALWTKGDLEAASRSIEDGIALLRKSGDVTQSFSGAVIVANIRLAQGRLREAQRTYEQALQLANQSMETFTPPVVDLYVGMSEILRERDDLSSAGHYLLQTKDVSQHGGIAEYRHRWYVAMALVKQAEGDLDEALDLLDEAERLFVPSPDPIVRPIAALKARLWILQGKLTEAEAWSRQRNLSPDDEPEYLREFELITLARLLIAQYRRRQSDTALGDALRLLERLRKSAEQGARNGSLIEILALQALVFDANGDEHRAHAALERALVMAEPEGFIRAFVDEGAPIAQLLTRANARGILPDYTARLMGAFESEGLRSKEKAVLNPAKPDQPLIEPLSQRELEVLRLVAQGLSNREISERLFVALNTVKGHNRVIFSKLQVQRRTEAIVRARELGLL
jgi:LuxR family transcriptional regulator, maltose regulon positive regulatory protein